MRLRRRRMDRERNKRIQRDRFESVFYPPVCSYMYQYGGLEIWIISIYNVGCIFGTGTARRRCSIYNAGATR